MEGTHGRSHRLRRGRYSETGRIYLVTTTTHDRYPVFQDIRAGRALVQALKTERRVDTLCFVVMPDHLHWLIQLNWIEPLERIVGRVKSKSARAVNQLFNHRGRLWQDGFHDRALRREEDLIAVARYVVANPLRAGLVRSVGDYPLWDAVWL
ncbi:transposase [Ectothiorhodospiraceae bacterium WFHF3C12]|nr:transposase [Ectothiorhodospiraceae bacterium WFHF3C12]